jgi:peptidoglycan/LPS O-acetylase OafA/YrhL
MYLRLDALRGVAACSVLLYHSKFTVWDEPTALMRNAYLAVDLFFVISGFVMQHAYGARIRQGMPLFDYMVLRFGRIYPLHLFMLLVWVPYIAFKTYLFRQGFGGSDPSIDSNAWTFLSNLLLIQAWHLHDSLNWNYPSWSISAEWAVYLLFFAWSSVRMMTSRWWAPLLLSATTYGLLAWIDPGTLGFTFDHGVLRCLAAFSLGMGMHEIHARWGGRVQALAGWELAAVSATLICLSLADHSPWALHLTPLAFAALVLVQADPRRGWVGRALDLPWLRQLGLWSYAIYMLNGIVTAAASNVLAHVFKVSVGQGLGWLAVLINAGMLLVSIVLAKPCYEWIELKGRNAARNWLAASRVDTRLNQA